MLILLVCGQKKTNQYMSENSIVYSDVDFDTSTNGVAGKMGYLKL